MVEDVHVVETEAFEALVERGEQVFAASEVAVGAEPHLVAGLGADDEFVAVMVEILVQQSSAVLFGRAGFRAVVVGQIEVGHAVVECGEHDLPHGVVWGDVAEVVPEAEGDGRQFQAACAHVVVGHAVIACRRWRVDGGWFEQGSSLKKRGCSPRCVARRR